MESLVGTLVVLVMFIAALIALDLAAVQWGADYRPSEPGRRGEWSQRWW